MHEGRSVGAEQARCRGAAEMQDALGTIEGRWKMMILAHLFGEDVMRFSDLQRAIPRVSQKMLIQQLRGLESDGVISRKVYAQVPPRVEYQLTALGRGLEPVFLALKDWVELRRIGTSSNQSKQGSDARPSVPRQHRM